MTYDYVLGMDVGKYFHNACILNNDGTQVLSKRINGHEKTLRTLFETYAAKGRHILIVVDQPKDLTPVWYTSRFSAIRAGRKSFLPTMPKFSSEQFKHDAVALYENNEDLFLAAATAGLRVNRASLHQ
ncbi:hypothetical protein CDES_05570 [Corynebacterium deserti GIMN1.010]|uniref:Transposase IS110-like N-terminal domain-containing protein n=1 Tax=Corynebacterium deserti GIMN1.010 TaxID=931089 RepID=A0A0M4CIU7_9CORY|nr:hypothetical protein CDES_05570 [Corynebacterium deserti GIMN1.010]